MTHKMADDVNMPEDHVNGFEETPGEGEKHGENVEIDEHTIEDEENLEELVENASNGRIMQYCTVSINSSVVQWGLHLRIGSTSEPLMCISFHVLKNNDPKIAKMLWT